jgi:hypothetical protein
MKDEKGNEVFPGVINKFKAAVYPPGYFPGKKLKFFFNWYCLEDPKDGVPEVLVKHYNNHCCFQILKLDKYNRKNSYISVKSIS